MGEFDLIERYFARKVRGRPSQASVALGPGDDCALLVPAPGQQLAVSSDMLVEGRHFLPQVNPADLGHKALAVNLSDLAAMGAAPLAFTLALALPPARAVDAAWLHAFSDGLLALADAHACPLVGGDTTAGPLTISITILGQVPAGQALRRYGAQPGDEVWVSGALGLARLALGVQRDEWTVPPELYPVAHRHLARPAPRLALGTALRGVASSALDVSDGLLGDLQHILRASGVGARMQVAAVLRTAALDGGDQSISRIPRERLLAATLAGGDDYELLFTAAAHRRDAVLRAASASGTPVSRIGTITAEPGLQLLDADGTALDARHYLGFDHFA